MVPIADPLTAFWIARRVRREVRDWMALPWPSKCYDLTLWFFQFITFVALLLSIWAGAALALAL